MQEGKLSAAWNWLTGGNQDEQPNAKPVSESAQRIASWRDLPKKSEEDYRIEQHAVLFTEALSTKDPIKHLRDMYNGHLEGDFKTWAKKNHPNNDWVKKNVW